MSVCLALIPVALVMRVAMGKEKFDDFIEANTAIINTNLKDDNKLKECINKAGYDTINFFGDIKTHIGKGKYTFIIWKKDDHGNIYIDMSKSYLETIEFKTFKNKLEQIYGENIFTESKVSKDKNERIDCFKTQFNNKEILIKTLDSYGLCLKENGDNISTNVEGYILNFKKTKEGYDLIIKSQSQEVEKLYPILKEFDNEYKKNVQGKTYENLVSKIKEIDMEIEEEEFLEDNSVVLTLSIN